MTTNETFSKIRARLIGGMMLNDRMANYYDFLGLRGFKRLHEYHYLRDAADLRGINRYYINHYNELMAEGQVTEGFTIPATWYASTRKTITSNVKRPAVKSAVEAWCEWCKGSKKLCETSYQDLCELAEVAAACKIKDLLSAADMDTKAADRLHIDLSGLDYDLPMICLMQDDLHDRYDQLSRDICVTIC